MTKYECEKRMMRLLEEIVDIYHDFNPEGGYLTLHYLSENENSIGKDAFYIGNTETDDEKHISFHVSKEEATI